MTNIKPRIEGNTLWIDDVRLTPKTNATLKVVEQPYFDQFPDAEGKFARIAYCIDYTLAAGETAFCLEFKMEGPSME